MPGMLFLIFVQSLCSSLEQKWGNERAITGRKIIMTCPLEGIPYNGDSREKVGLISLKG